MSKKLVQSKMKQEAIRRHLKCNKKQDNFDLNKYLEKPDCNTVRYDKKNYQVVRASRVKSIFVENTQFFIIENTKDDFDPFFNVK